MRSPGSAYWPMNPADLDPRDLPRLRAEMADWMHPERGQGFDFNMRQGMRAADAITEGKATRTPQQYMAYTLTLVTREWLNLRSASLYYVTPEMSRQARQMAASLPFYRPTPEDLPSPYGLIVYGAPLGEYRRDLGVATQMRGYLEETGRGKIAEELLANFEAHEDVPLVAMSWGTVAPGDASLPAWVHGGLWVSVYRWREEMLNSGVIVAPDIQDSLRSDLGPIVPDNECGSAFPGPDLVVSEDEADYLRGSDDPDLTSYWMKTLMATWLMMKRPVIIQRREEAPRQQRRQFERAGYRDNAVTVVDARPHRYADAGDGEHVVDRETGRKLTKRSYVSPHWRNQWYRSEGRHKPKYIEEHWRGPADGELSNIEKMAAGGAERVRVLRSADGEPS